jgi:hypothetical protein
MSAILRHRHPNRFTVLPNDAIRNPALSFRAVGVLAHLLSLPDGARVDSTTLAAAHKEGRDAVRAAFSELGEHGYYRREIVRLPDGTLRTEVVVSSTPMEETAGRTGDGFPGAGAPGPGFPASAEPASETQAPNEVPEEETSHPPNPPAQRGGGDPSGGGVGRRSVGTNPRAKGTNPRAETTTTEAEQARLDAEAHIAAVEAETAARRRETEEARALAAAFQAESAALSAALDDELLGAVLERAREGLPGPLATSPAGLTRAAVSWCRAAVATRPGDLVTAVRAALADGKAPDAGAPPLALLPAPPKTRPLVERIRDWLDRLRPTG